MMVADFPETTTGNHSIRPPLLPSEKNVDVSSPKTSIRPKSRQVSSRYLSPSPSISPNPNSVSKSSSLRSVTPSRSLISRNSITPVAKRSVSVDRRRPDLTLKPNNAGAAMVTSRRSLSVSFQGEVFSLPVSKTKMTPQSQSPRKGTTETKRKIDGEIGENTKPVDHHRWPGSTRQSNLSSSKSFSLDEQNNINCKRDLKIVNFNSRRASFDGNSIDLSNPDGNFVKDSYSDTDSVSSGGTSGNGSNRVRIGIITSPKFWQETNSRMRRLQDPSSPLSTSPRPKLKTPQKNLNSKRFSSDNNQLSSPKTMASPNRMRPPSPSKFMMTSSPSPSRRNSVSGINNNTPSVLSFAVDVRRGKVGFFDAHVLRLLYNRQLQWRFVNARNEDMILKQTHSAEENLWNAWITMSDLRDSVTKKRHRLQLLRQKLKLASILKAQMVLLEDYIDKDHSLSLVGAIEGLKASTLRLPVGGGATADLESMKDAISSALEVMEAMSSSMNSLYLQVEEANLMVTEITKLSSKETALLRVCKDFLSVLSALEVWDWSLRTHTLQTKRVVC